jgi:hypothetical protein
MVRDCVTVANRVRAVIERRAVTFAVMTAAALPLPWLLGLGSGAYVLVGLVVGLLAAAVIQAQPPDDRRFFAGLFLLGLALRLWALVIVQGWAVASGGPYLGPDATAYYVQSLALANNRVTVPMSPAVYFGLYDSGHYYLFATEIRFLGADLFALQLFNAGVTALIGPLVFGFGRIAGRRDASSLGALAGLYPSIIALSVNDLLKDPVVITAVMLGMWALARVLWAETGRRRLLLALGGGLVLAYVRSSRGYAVALLEIGVAATLAASWWMRAAPRPGRREWAALAVVLLVAEGLPFGLGWPLSPTYVMTQVRVSLSALGTGVNAKALPDQAPDRGQSGTGVAPDHPPGSGATRGGRRATGSASAPREPIDDRATLTERLSGVPAFTLAANAVRRVLGPFPWVPPPTWEAETILRGDYLLFPGMLVWYAVVPVGALGVGLMIWGVFRRRTVAPVELLSAIFVVELAATYFLLNLSYRQREFLFPFLLLPAGFACQILCHHRPWRRAYVMWWVAIILLAAAHLTARAVLT